MGVGGCVWVGRGGGLGVGGGGGDQHEYSEKSEINDWFRLVF